MPSTASRSPPTEIPLRRRCGAALGLELGRVRDRRPVGAGPLNSGRGTGRSGLCVDRLFRWVRRLRMFHVEHVCDGSCVGAWVSLRVRSCVCARSASTSVLLLSPRQFCLCVRVSSVSASFCVRVVLCPCTFLLPRGCRSGRWSVVRLRHGSPPRDLLPGRPVDLPSGTAPEAPTGVLPVDRAGDRSSRRGSVTRLVRLVSVPRRGRPSRRNHQSRRTAEPPKDRRKPEVR